MEKHKEKLEKYREEMTEKIKVLVKEVEEALGEYYEALRLPPYLEEEEKEFFIKRDFEEGDGIIIRIKLCFHYKFNWRKETENRWENEYFKSSDEEKARSFFQKANGIPRNLRLVCEALLEAIEKTRAETLALLEKKVGIIEEQKAELEQMEEIVGLYQLKHMKI